VGALFLIAMVASLAGGIWLETFLTAPDFLSTISGNKTQIALGVLLELTNGLAVIGIAVAMYPIFRKQYEALALGYVALRIIEAVIIVSAVISPLALIALSQEYIIAGAPDTSYFQILGSSLLAVRAIWVSTMLAIFFGLGALLFYYLLFQTELVPRFISVWGFIAVALVLLWNLVEFFGIRISAGIVLALPMILNEIFLGIWLIVKGFNASATVFESA